MKVRPQLVAAALGIVSLALPKTSRAGGFYVPEVGPAAVGMAGAMTALAEDPSAVFHNPAGLADRPGFELQLSANMFLPDVAFYRRPVEDPGTGQTLRFGRVENENAVVAAPYLGATERLDRRWVVGLALFAPFGATIDYPERGAQRQVVTGMRLRTVSLSPGFGVRLPAGFRVGAALNLLFGDLRIGQANSLTYVTGDPEQYPDPSADIEGSTVIEGRDPFTVTATLGAQWTRGRWRVGLSLMTPATLELEGDARVENSGIGALMAEDGTMLQAEGARTDQVRMDIPLPLVARAGVAFAPSPRLLLSVDVNWQRWSEFDRLTVDFVNEHELLPVPNAYLYDVNVEQGWRDTFSFRAGGQYQPRAGRGWPSLVRAGLVVDQSPVDDRHFGLLAPDSDKLGVSAGLRWGVGDFDLDVGYMHLFLAERNVQGSAGTILNKPAPSFFEGVTRAAFDIVVVAVSWRR